MTRQVVLIEGNRHKRRPSALARAGGKRRASDVLFSDAYVCDEDSWETEEPLPEEKLTKKTPDG